MVGLPRYPIDPGKMFYDMRRDTAQAFTAANTRAERYYPWMTFGCMDFDATRWGTVVGTAWKTFHIVGGPNSHPKYTLYGGIIAPAGGSQIRVLYMDGATELHVEDVASTGGAVAFWGLDYDLLGVPTPPVKHGSFYFFVQARSVIAGQTTTLNTLTSWGVDPDTSSYIPS